MDIIQKSRKQAYAIVGQYTLRIAKLSKDLSKFSSTFSCPILRGLGLGLVLGLG